MEQELDIPRQHLVVLASMETQSQAAGKSAIMVPNWATIALALCGCLAAGLAFGALVRFELAGLAWAFGAIGLWALGCFATARANRAKPPPEEDILHVAELKHRTKAGEFGRPVRRGRIAWLDRGRLYYPPGRHAELSEYETFSIEAPEDSVYRLVLWRPPGPISRESRILAVLAAFQSLGIGVAVVGFAITISRYGLRDDVLVLPLLVGIDAALVLLTLRMLQRTRRVNPRTGRWARHNLLVEAKRYRAAELAQILRRCLQPEDVFIEEQTEYRISREEGV